ncbi:CD3324 family protein [Sporosalibacterium faouarense]|uniref:CD3324 family protein n=1 Tax=Sporosalibacterium faouarense TaxID=516123 RepID=UPI00141CB1D5|nr:CD3324 family protein [Sporosalibacterium faouarense]MTI49131.1 hypothetical protein [Bacillota bacterium]
MSYVNVEDILPQDIIESIQKYVDGRYVYIPRKSSKRKVWGESTNTRNEIRERNSSIYEEYLKGVEVKYIAVEYHLSKKSIYRIITQQKRKLQDNKL